MRVLHLYSNWKWTGPAEHALNLAISLVKRGYDLTFVCSKPPREVEDSLKKRAEESGLSLVNNFYMNKHFNILHNALDIMRLTRFIKENRFELIHTHLFNDHFITGVSTRRLSKEVSLIRSVYAGRWIVLQYKKQDAIIFY